ncbi:MAG: hypothetical protein SGI97_09750 [candidate division Zixibacteria bacterium]|nr:hypothetical protein [candidate division Zixibacteria bacterium]
MILIVGLTILLYNYTPDYIPSKEVEVPVPGKNGNFTDAAKQDALVPKDTVNYWQASNLAMLEGDKNKDLILYGKDILASLIAEILFMPILYLWVTKTVRQ